MLDGAESFGVVWMSQIGGRGSSSTGAWAWAAPRRNQPSSAPSKQALGPKFMADFMGSGHISKKPFDQ